MVKAKKSKKEEIPTDGMEKDTVTRTEHYDAEEDTKKSKKEKKKSSIKKDILADTANNDDVKVIQKGVEELKFSSKKKEKKIEEELENFSENEVELIRTKPCKEKKAGFGLLLVDDEDDNDEEPELILQNENEMDMETSKKNEKFALKDRNKTNKKSKKSRKRQDDSDDDIDKVLAQLEEEYSGQKAIKPFEVSVEKNIPKEVPINIKGRDNADDVVPIVEGDDNLEEINTVKSAAQKKKEKKERQKKEALLAKQKKSMEKTDEIEDKENPEFSTDPKDIEIENEKLVEDEDEDSRKDDKKKKKKGKKEKDEDKEKDKKKGLSKVMVAAMQERLKKIKEEEERQQREQEERIEREEELERLRLENIRLEQERKEKKKQKEAERRARLKAEGKLLSKKQKEDRARAQAMLDALKAQGIEIPDPAEKRVRPGTRSRSNKKKDQKPKSNDSNKLTDIKMEVSTTDENNQSKLTEKISKDTVKDEWDASLSEEENSENLIESKKKILNKNFKNERSVSKESESEEDISNEELSNEESDENEIENKRNDEVKQDRAIERIEKRKIDHEQKRNLENLRAAVVCVLGHVDTGKTKILDKLRRTHVQDSEAGGITQQIGATNVPIDAIKEQTKIVKGASSLQFKLPGLLIIDTPGHESFSNLRSRGSSLCDIAILVIDIMHGLEPQTIESINLLKSKKTPFIVALNKIDRLYDWKITPRKDVEDVIKGQEQNTQMEFIKRTKEIIVQLAEQGLNAALFYENPDIRSYVSLVPTSAITGEGMGNLLFLIVESCQNLLAKRLTFSEELHATVLEVKAIPGLGTTIDAILINGRLREGDTIIIAGTDGPIVTQIRSLLMPQPLKELRVKNAYIEYKEVQAAQGVKIAGKDLEKAIAGINLLVAHKPDEIEICKAEVARELKHALSHIKLTERGVYVQASTLGSLEALLEFLKTSKIPYSAIRIGPVVKRDVMKASTMLEHEPQYATILAFDVKVERDAQELADTLGVKIFQADIIYHLFDKFKAYRDELKQKKRDEFKSIAVFPCKLKILPQFIFNSRDPIVLGVMVENGIVREGTPLCVPSKDFVDIGIVTSIEYNHKQIESARKGQEVCIKIEPIPGEAPKMFGRHFEETDLLVSKISRQSIDACKDYFRDDLIKADWALMVELKKLFEIM